MRQICKDCGVPSVGYGHKRTSLRGTKFLKALSERAARKLRVPDAFVAKARRAIGDKCLLYGPKKEVYQLRVKKEDGEWHFKGGWKNFFHNYKLGSGYIVRFKYVAAQAFEAEIYDTFIEEIVFGFTTQELEDRRGRAREQMRRQRAEAKRAKQNHGREQRTEVKIELGTSATKGPVRRLGRPAMAVKEWEEGCSMTLYGTNLMSFTKFQLRHHLRVRDLSEDGSKQELKNRLRKYIALRDEA